MGLEEEVGEQVLDRHPVVANVVISVDGRVPEPVQGALACQDAVPALGLELAPEHGQHRAAAHLIVIDQILIAEADPGDPLRDYGRKVVLDQRRVGTSSKQAANRAARQADRSVVRVDCRIQDSRCWWTN